MGKRFKKRFRNICCLCELSPGTKDEETNGKKSEPAVPAKSKTKAKKATKIEIILQEADKLERKLKSLEEFFDAVVEKYRATEREIGAFFSESVVENMVKKYAYTATPLMIYPRMRFDKESSTLHGLSTSMKITDENGNLTGTESTITGNDVDDSTKEKCQVPSLVYYCKRMFFQNGTPDGEPQVYRRFATDLATHYIDNARQNVNRGADKIGLNDRHLIPLRMMCYELLVIKNAVKLQEGDVTRLRDADDTFQLQGRFGQTDEIGCGLARARRQLKEKNFLDISGLTKVIQPLPSMQVVLHNEIMTTLNFPFRVTLRDIMLKNKFDESHAKFLCINMLTSLKHLHSLNMIHGQITPSKVLFTQYGYPCLTGIETFGNHGDLVRPKPRIEYTSPEQIQNEPITEATDVFQIGILVYSIIYGKSPFKADTYFKTEENMLDETFTPEFQTDTFTKDGRYFVRKLLKVNPNDRFKLDRCRKPLDKAVKWFSSLNQDEILTQIYPSPFKAPLMRQILAD